MTDETRLKDQMLSEIIAAFPIGIAIYDAAGQCISTNNSLAQIIEATTQQVLKQNYNHLASWKKSGLLDIARKVVRNKSALRHEIVTISSFGKEVFIDCHLVPFGINGLLFMAQDITERMRTEKLLKENEKQFKTLFMSIPDGFYLSEILYDRNGNPCDYRYRSPDYRCDHAADERDRIG